MKKKSAAKKKKIIISMFLLIVMLVVLVSCFSSGENSENVSGENIISSQNNDNNQDDVKVTEKAISGVKKVGNIEISNINIKLVEDKKCEITANVKNTSDEYIESTNVEIRVKNEKGEIKEVLGGIITELAGYEPSTFVTYVLKDITDAYDIEFVAIKD